MMHEQHSPEMMQKAAKVAAMMRQMKSRAGMSSEEMHKDDRKEAMEETPIRLNKALGKKK
ncbi:hypothetical protein HZB78_05530 [Candidatus Collierbacteria bacterium]|nr:hypothetical protein [Candidatus Collierbacteria bacterium]